MKTMHTTDKKHGNLIEPTEIKVLAGSDIIQIPFRSLVPFLLITFGLAWGILTLFIFLPVPMNKMFGKLTGEHPLFFLSVYAPAIAAFIIVSYKSGTEGLKRYLSRLSDVAIFFIMVSFFDCWHTINFLSRVRMEG